MVLCRISENVSFEIALAGFIRQTKYERYVDKHARFCNTPSQITYDANNFINFPKDNKLLAIIALFLAIW